NDKQSYLLGILMEIKKSMNFQNETEFVSFLINYIKENPSKIGIFLFNDIEIDKYNMIRKSQDIQVITGNNQNIYDEECIDFIKSLANLSKNGALIKAMNFPSNIIDYEKYQEY